MCHTDVIDAGRLINLDWDGYALCLAMKRHVPKHDRGT